MNQDDQVIILKRRAFRLALLLEAKLQSGVLLAVCQNVSLHYRVYNNARH